MDRVLVIGGGITGIQASLDLAQLGFEVILLERENELGGKLTQLSTLFPKGDSSREFLASKRRKLEAYHSTIKIKTATAIEKVTSTSSGYQIVLRGEGKPLEVGAVVVSTGFDPFDPTVLEEYGYGRHQDVITAFELEAMLKEEKVLRPSNGIPPQQITFLQCVGSRDRNTNRYCSYFCCTYAVKEALSIKKLNPHAEVCIMYMDIRTPYLYEHLYTEAREKGVTFIKSRVSGISEHRGALALDMENTITGETESLSSELVVLSIGGVPAAHTKELATHFKLPLSDQGFFERGDEPVGTTSPGVFIAGAASGLKDIPHCLAEASASALSVSIFFRQRKT